MASDHPQTDIILQFFHDLSQIPRCSRKEDAIRDWLVEWSKGEGFEYKLDAVKNIVIKVPANAGYEDSDPVVIQGHMDMVCEKSKGFDHDFDKDPITFVYEGEWLTADNTTLGADNGIAIAMAMAAAVDKELPRPALELLFTVDEETGLTGAVELGDDMLEGKILLNVDSEDEGVFTVGCCGGKDADSSVPVEEGALPDGYEILTLVAGGMAGGHSGVDIHEQRANAIQVLARALNAVLAEGDVRIAGLLGGTAHNAIPRDAEATVGLPADLVDKAKAAVATVEAQAKAEYAKTDPKLSIAFEPVGEASCPLTAAGTRKAVDFILAMPHGVADYNKDVAGLVETSNNLATVKLEGGKVTILTSQRSSNMDKLDLLTDRIVGLARVGGGEAEVGGGYPGWQPNMDSALLAKCQGVYKKLYNKEPVVEIIHAGLECGIIGAKYDGMDMISFGPTIKNPHSPDEKIEIATVGMVWDFMAALFVALK